MGSTHVETVPHTWDGEWVESDSCQGPVVQVYEGARRDLILR